MSPQQDNRRPPVEPVEPVNPHRYCGLDYPHSSHGYRLPLGTLERCDGSTRRVDTADAERAAAERALCNRRVGECHDSMCPIHGSGDEGCAPGGWAKT